MASGSPVGPAPAATPPATPQAPQAGVAGQKGSELVATENHSVSAMEPGAIDRGVASCCVALSPPPLYYQRRHRSDRQIRGASPTAAHVASPRTSDRKKKQRPATLVLASDRRSFFEEIIEVFSALVSAGVAAGAAVLVFAGGVRWVASLKQQERRRGWEGWDELGWDDRMG